MKKLLTMIMALAAAGMATYAQDDVQKAAAEAAAAFTEAPKQADAVKKAQYWTNSASFDLGFNQTGLWSWAAGGYNTLTLNAGIDAKANYAKKLMTWNNRLQLNYGFLWSADKSNLLQKSTDRLYFESKWAYRTKEKSKWNYTASFDFRTQFTDSYDSYKQDSESGKWEGTLRSGLLSPAYTNIALGMEWKPTDWFDVNLAPVTGGFTIVTNETLRPTYGMKLIEEGGTAYKPARFQFGAQLKIDAKAVFNKVLTYDTQLVLFTDYLDHPFEYTRVNWDNKLTWQVTKYFKTALNTWLIYDPLVSIDGVVSKIQFKEFFSIALTYSITNKK